MRICAAAFAFALAGLTAPAARAAASRCWVDHGAVVVSAAFGGIAGDFLLDLSAPRSVLHLDVAQANGIGAADVRDTLTLAGQRLPAHFTVASLDSRSLGLPTSISGLIGADVLAGRVIDLSVSPCRIRLWSARPPRWRWKTRLPIVWIDGVPTVAATVSDGRTAVAGRFAIDTGTAGVRLSGSAAHLSRAPKGIDPDSRLDPPARLDALGLDGAALRRLPSALASDLPAGVLGGVGDAVWSRYDLRIDLRRGWLELRERNLSPSHASGAGAVVSPRQR